MFRTVCLGAAIAVAAASVVVSVDASQPAAKATPVAPDREQLMKSLVEVSIEDPADASTRLRLAVMLIQAGRADEAQRWLDEAAALDPVLHEQVVAALNGEAPPATERMTPCMGTTGPDVIVGEMPSVAFHTSGGAVGGIHAYSIGTTSCNQGTMNVQWDDDAPAPSNRHPVIAQNLFRLKDGKFEQVGQSWLKHGFTALTGNLCCSCSGQGGNVLGVGCSDPYSASLNGNYTYLGAKHEVNPSNGLYPHPFGGFPNNAPIGKRLQVHETDLETTTSGSAVKYFIEGHYIAPDDAEWNNDNNNASYRPVIVNASRSISVIGQTQREKPAILAWQDTDAAVTVENIDVDSDGRFILAYKVTDNGDGTWHYEFALHNLNSDRSGGSFSIPVADSVNVTNIGFHDVDWHSGAPYANTDWNSSVGGGAVTWQSPQTFAQNQNTNALRWGTLYNFRFDADQPPAAANATLGLFKPGTPSSMSVAVQGPSAPPCEYDLDGDGQVGASDLALLLGDWVHYGAGGLAEMLGAWGACP